MKNKVFSDYGGFPYEKIGFDTPSRLGGVLMCFITQEQNRNCYMFKSVSPVLQYYSQAFRKQKHPTILYGRLLGHEVV